MLGVLLPGPHAAGLYPVLAGVLVYRDGLGSVFRADAVELSNQGRVMCFINKVSAESKTNIRDAVDTAEERLAALSPELYLTLALTGRTPWPLL